MSNETPRAACAAGCCGKAHGQCGSCCSSNEILLCKEEVAILEALAQLAFLPIMEHRAQEKSTYRPVYESYTMSEETFSNVIGSLLFKKLISIDATLPVQNVLYPISKQAAGTHCGSIALTLQGQEAITLLSLMDSDLSSNQN